MDLATFTKWPIVKFLEERGWLYFPPMAYDDYLIFTHSKRQLVLHVLPGQGCVPATGKTH
jgi:hypothetical protein